MAGIARKVGSKDSRFFVSTYSPLRFRARAFRFHRASIGRTKGTERASLSSSFSFTRCERRRRKNENRIFFSRALSRPREGRIRRVSSFRACILVSLWRIGFGRDSGNGKLEDLVRLALKRLNVSYLTILSRLVWFEREALVCHERGWEEDICDFRWTTELIYMPTTRALHFPQLYHLFVIMKRNV